MPDPDLLPPGRGIRSAPGPAGGLGPVLRGARRRRQRQTALASGSLLAVAIGTIWALPVQTDMQGPDTLATTSSPTAPAVVVTLSPQPNRSAMPSVGPSPLRSSVQATGPAIGPVQATPTPSGASPTPNSGRVDPTARRLDGNTVMTRPQCGTASEPTTTPAWCLYAGRAPLDETTLELQLSAYRGAADSTGTLDWTSTKQVSAEIVNAQGRVVWTYQPAAEPTTHSESVLPSRGVGWGVAWQYVDDAGRRLPKGQYTLRIRCTARQLVDTTVSTSVDVP